MKNYKTIKNASGLETTAPDFTNTLVDKALKKSAGYLFAPLGKDDFLSAEAFTDYKESIECLQYVLSTQKAPICTASNMGTVLNKLGIEDNIAESISVVLKKVNVNKIDYSTEGGARVKALNEKAKAIRESGKSQSEKDSELKPITEEIATIKRTEAIYETSYLFDISPNTFRAQLELAIANCLASIEPESTYIRQCFTKRYKKAMEYGMPYNQYMEYALTNNYVEFKAVYDDLQKAHKERKANIEALSKIEKAKEESKPESKPESKKALNQLTI